MLQDAMGRLRAPGRQGASGGGLTALGWLYIDTGRWDEALEAAAEAADLAEANGMRMVAASADLITATVGRQGVKNSADVDSFCVSHHFAIEAVSLSSSPRR
jgi:hypothetical protein